jgi:pyruvate kinase
VRDVDEMVDLVQQHLTAAGLASAGDKLVLVFGAPVFVRGRTNSIRIHQVSS